MLSSTEVIEISKAGGFRYISFYPSEFVVARGVEVEKEMNGEIVEKLEVVCIDYEVVRKKKEEGGEENEKEKESEQTEKKLSFELGRYKTANKTFEEFLPKHDHVHMFFFGPVVKPARRR